MLGTSHFNMSFFKHGIVAEMPPGYRFLPTDEELVTHYLTNKAFFRPLPAQVIQDIDATDLYSKPPMALVANACSERAWYFFIHLDQHFHGRREKVRVVGNGMGYWRNPTKGQENSLENGRVSVTSSA
ncbi:hypothetical protein RJ639_038753 [Escallonia herrerae]|uniref:NAC domain-containing protein n=1 Tax=Escallonia herrerae TaxID=1293975 RepID=A0AA88WI35_9ASTE|nr:hypothetical protein RJ639_038753 [Escallonia herrerae]